MIKKEHEVRGLRTAREFMVVVSSVPVNATLGISKPALVAFKSKIAEASGVLPSVFMATWAKKELLISNKTISNFNFIMESSKLLPKI
jgi:hypothetical protein